jgi:8-oxo-dGTP diphosphatase
MNGPALEKNPTFVPVVAAALVRPDGHVLMQQRRYAGDYGGLWEFPGGKIEPGESPESALIREIAEELGLALDPAAMAPLSFASDPALPPAPRAPHVILLYKCTAWTGEARCLAGETITWVPISALLELPMPPLDIPLAKAMILSI